MYKTRFQGNYTLTQYNIVRAIKTKAVRNKTVTANNKGENIMQQADSIQPAPKVSTIFERIARLFCRSRVSTPVSDQFMTHIDWPDSDSEPSCCERDNQPVSGGYNEAFIMQYWASYNPRY